MTVESLIKSAIADEVNAKLDAKIVKEIVDKKIQRLTKKMVDELDIESIVRKELKDFFNTYDGQKLIRSTIANSMRITMVKGGGRVEELTDEEMAEEYVKGLCKTCKVDVCRHSKIQTCATKESLKQTYLAGLKAGRQKWHKIFEDKPYYNEYWDLPQDRLPKIENFYFVKLKNGFIKICELKHDHWSRKKYFCDLNGGTQSNVAEWLDYPVIQGE